MSQEEEKFLSRRLSEDLESLERYVEEFSAFLPLAVSIVNPSGVIVDINQAMIDLCRYTNVDLIGQGMDSLFKDKEKAEEFLSLVFKQGLVKNCELVLLHKQGKEIPVSASGGVRKDQDGNIIGSFIALVDITELKKFQGELEKKVEEKTKELQKANQKLEEMLKESKRAEAALVNIVEDLDRAKQQVQEERNKTEAVLKSLVDGLIVFDKNQRISLVNPEAEKILDIKQKQVLGKKFEDLGEQPKMAKLYRVLGKELSWTGQRYEFSVGESLKRYYQVTIAPVSAHKQIMGLMLLIRDITRDKEVERLKTEFVSIAAHQLRTPLSAIKWTLKMLLDEDAGKVSEGQEEFIKRAYQSNERMIALINDLLNVARIEEGRFIYETKECSIVEIIETIIGNLKSLAKQKEITIDFKKPSKKIPLIKIDQEKIELVIQNLIDNAIRYSKTKQSVTVSVEYANMEVKVMVKDNGIGIPENQQKRLFKKFFRADNAVKIQTEGSGLGLFICKNIVEAHQGKIGFESELGKGATFWFILPVNNQ